MTSDGMITDLLYHSLPKNGSIFCIKNHFLLRQHRIMGQGDSAGDFGPSESMENAGILDVFPIFHTARLGQKVRRSPQLPLCGVALIGYCHFPVGEIE
ncbi:MAG: hypothetical protein MR913_02665 [Clostridiales bacterium]|nr:hypothetical protein [Clostridiales bacterium]